MRTPALVARIGMCMFKNMAQYLAMAHLGQCHMDLSGRVKTEHGPADMRLMIWYGTATAEATCAATLPEFSGVKQVVPLQIKFHRHGTSALLSVKVSPRSPAVGSVETREEACASAQKSRSPSAAAGVNAVSRPAGLDVPWVRQVQPTSEAVSTAVVTSRPAGLDGPWVRQVLLTVLVTQAVATAVTIAARVAMTSAEMNVKGSAAVLAMTPSAPAATETDAMPPPMPTSAVAAAATTVRTLVTAEMTSVIAAARVIAGKIDETTVTSVGAMPAALHADLHEAAVPAGRRLCATNVGSRCTRSHRLCQGHG